MSLQDLRKLEEERVQAYLSSPRNADLPELVRRWIAEGEGEAQDEFVSITVGNWRERSSFNLCAPPFCVCCGCALPEGGHPVRVRLAESETCTEFDETLDTCPSCSEEWVAASEAIGARESDVERVLQAARDAIASIPVNDATVEGRAKALSKIDDIIDRRALQRARRVA